MPVKIRCPNPACGKAGSIADEYIGQTVRCPHCRMKFAVPASGDAMPSAPAEYAEVSAGVPLTSAGAGKAFSAAMPERVGRFQIRAVLGSGAFGTVYRAFDPDLDREVALKVPQAATLENPKHSERFLREAKSAARLHHAHIVPVYETGRDGNQPYIATALIDGRTLSEILDAGPVDFREAAQWVRALAEALAYAHEQGIVHRDIKPANVIIDRKNQPYLMDFGLAHRHDALTKLTHVGALLGTPGYMSPEQAKGQGGPALPASDQYSLGVMLYELLCGRTPFSGPPEVVLFNAIHTEPPVPQSIKADIPAGLQRICLKAMSKQAADRYATCKELADELGRWLTDGGAVLAVPSPSRRRTEGLSAASPSRSRAPLLVGAGAAGALLLAVGIWALFLSTNTRLPPVQAHGSAPITPPEPQPLPGQKWPPDPPDPPAPQLRLLPSPGEVTAPGGTPGTFAIHRGSSLKVPFAVDRAGFEGPITLHLEGLPTGVKATSELIIPMGKSVASIELAAAPDAPIREAFAPAAPVGILAVPVRVVAKFGDKPVAMTLNLTVTRGLSEKPSILPLDERSANGAPAIQIDYLHARALKYQFDPNAQTYSAIVPSASSAPARFLDPQRLVVVTASFPYQKQLEHLRQFFRCHSVQDLFQRADAPRIVGLYVQRSELSVDGREISKVDLYGNDYADWRKTRLTLALQAFFRSMVIDSKNAVEWGEILGPNLATPLPWLATSDGSPGEYPRLTITGFIPDKTISEPPTSGQIKSAPFAKLPAELRERFKGNFNAFDPWARLPADWDDRPPGNVKPLQVKPAAVPIRNKHEDVLARFIDVDVQPGKTYRYYIQVRAERPRSLNTLREPIAPEDHLLSPAVVVEKSIPAEHVFYVVDMPRAQLVSKEKGANDLSLANTELAAVQIHQWAHSLERMGSVGTWVIAERLLIRRGDAVARSGVRVQAPRWEPEQGRLVLPRFTGFANFWAEPPPLVVDFEGGKHNGYKVGNKTVYDEAAVEMLILTPDNQLVLRNSREDTADQDRLERHRRWWEDLRGKDRFGVDMFTQPKGR